VAGRIIDTMAERVLFDRYRLVERVGSGGTAEVWRAVDERTGDEVALKRLHPIVFGSEAGRRRLVREFRALRGLEHPHVVRVRDLEMSGDEAALVLDFVAGQSLRDRLAGGARVPVDEAVRIAGQVAAALDAAHAAGITHRDVSPGNVLLDARGTAHLTDFGIADEGTDETAVTATGTLVGTLRYVAPEQLRGEPATAASDIFGLAAITWEMLAGQPAFAASTPVGLVEAQRAGPLPIDGLDPAVEAVLRGALSEDPAARPRSGGAFVAELRAALDDAPTLVTVAAVAGAGAARRGVAASAPGEASRVSTAPVRPTPRARRAAGPVAVAAALALGGLVIAAALGGPERAEPTDPGGAAATPAPTLVAEPTPAPPADEGADRGEGNGNDKGKDDKDDKDDKGEGNEGRGKGNDG
jgi:hypothetical protein